MDIFLATQPIFDQQNRVFGYEVLYRENERNAFPEGKNPNSASGSALAQCFLDFGLPTLTHNTRAFINFPSELLQNEVATIFPKDELVIEILETVEITPQIIEACRRLKSLGYLLAIDDFTYRPGYESLIPLVDIIKVDFKLSPPAEQKAIVQRYKRKGLWFLAEKVETEEEHIRAIKQGYTYFQGYFYARPSISHTRKLSPYSQTRMRLIRLLHESIPDLRKIAELIESDVAFSYQILKLVNSAYYSPRSPITSIPLAVSAIGIEELRKWLYVTFISGLKEDKPSELVRISMQRGKFMEIIGNATGHGNMKRMMMTIGMFSLLDVLLECPMAEAIRDMHFPPEVEDVLTGSADSGFLYACYKLMLCYDQGLWKQAIEFGGEIGVTPRLLQKAYLDALTWVKHFYDEK